MSQRQIEELLSQQADRLIAAPKRAGQERAAELASVDRAGLTRDEQRVLGGLMALARQVQAELVPIEPRQAFAAELKARLMARRLAAGQPDAKSGRGMIWVWGVAGALGLAGLGFLGYRAARAGAGWISAAAANRNAGAALPKA
jgi:hypothetical protein